MLDVVGYFLDFVGLKLYFKTLTIYTILKYDRLIINNLYQQIRRKRLCILKLSCSNVKIVKYYIILFNHVYEYLYDKYYFHDLFWKVIT